jgi:cytochrome c oxidase cbb3-type subunit 3
MSTQDHEHEGHEVIGKTPEGVPIFHGPDGLAETDTPMPRWMTVVYITTVLWGLAYIVVRPGTGVDLAHWSQYQQYDNEIAQAKVLYAAAESANPEELAEKQAKDSGAIAAGKALFAANCAACHGAEAKGAIGPNLTDATWLYGGSPHEIAHTITNGTKKGMPTFKTTFSGAQIAQLADFVHSLHEAGEGH